MKAYPVENHMPSLVPEGKNWKLIWADEFDAPELDLTKWDFRESMMGRPCQHWVKDAIELDGNSNIVFKIVKRDGVYCTTQLQTGYNFMDAPPENFGSDSVTGKNEGSQSWFNWQIGAIKEPKFMHKYGYYECRCKLQKNSGWWTAFWLQSPIQGSTLNPEFSGIEVDIMENFNHSDETIIQHNNHWNGCGSQHQSTGAHNVQLSNTEDGYHVFGVEWTKDFYRYYVDGIMTWEVKAPYPVSQTEQFIYLTTEAIGYRKSTWHCWDKLQAAYEAGDTFVVDYVRVFDEV